MVSMVSENIDSFLDNEITSDIFSFNNFLIKPAIE